MYCYLQKDSSRGESGNDYEGAYLLLSSSAHYSSSPFSSWGFNRVSTPTLDSFLVVATQIKGPSLYPYLLLGLLKRQRILCTRMCSCTHAHVRPKPFDQYPTAKYHSMAFFQLTARLLH